MGGSNVGLLVDTKGAGTNFFLGTEDGTIMTTGGPALFLDPLTVDMTFDMVMSSGSVGGPTAASTGDGIHLDGVAGSLTIADLQVADAAMEGIQIEQSTGNFTFTLATITTAGTHGVLIGSMGANTGTVTITEGAISGTGMDGVNINNAGRFNLSDTTFTTIGAATGSFMNSTLSGSGNIHAMGFLSNDNGGNVGTILFNGGANQAP